MNRPYIICHILSALDGKITGEFFGTPQTQQVSEEYARIRNEFCADAWLYGTVTTKEFTGNRKPMLHEIVQPVPDGDYVAEHNSPLYYISIDTAGEIGWESGIFCKAGRPDSHVIEILTEQTPLAYRAYLREKGVSYLLAGDDMLDCQLAAEKLCSLFGIKKMLICGGGTVNWTFLQQGVMDELSLLLAPAADGNPSSVTVFERAPQLPFSAPAEFKLNGIERLKGNGIRLCYLIKK